MEMSLHVGKFHAMKQSWFLVATWSWGFTE